MLTLIGLGLFDENDLTLRGINEAKAADEVFIELYTGKWFGSINELEKIIGKKIIELKRKDLEEDSKKILEKAKEKNIAIFVQGDPLVATTHIALLLEARKLGIKTKVIHNASIVSAIVETGLHIYKFGPTVTIPFLEKTKGILPVSVYETIAENKKRGLHTLCLLDVEEENKYMTVQEALDILLQLEKKIGKKIITETTDVIVFVKAGGEPTIKYGKANKFREFTGIPAVLIVPGDLHFTEKEVLSLLYSET